MRRSFATAALLTVIASGLPAGADPSADARLFRVHGIHVNVFRPMGSLSGAVLPQPMPIHAEGEAEVELSMFFGSVDELADVSGSWEPEEGGCISLFRASVIDEGCGRLEVIPDGAMQTTRIVGELASTEMSYDSENGFQVIGPSTISVDLTFTGSSVIEHSPFSWAAAGVCGLPPETRGVFAETSQEFHRTAPGAGSLVSAAIGPVDVTAYEPLMLEGIMAGAGACV